MHGIRAPRQSFLSARAWHTEDITKQAWQSWQAGKVRGVTDYKFKRTWFNFVRVVARSAAV